MAKAYWVATYRAVHDPDKLAAYAKLAGPALMAHGAKFLARGMPARIYESAVNMRVVIAEFPSVADAVAAHDSPAYAEAMRVLGDAVDRELRIVEGVE